MKKPVLKIIISSLVIISSIFSIGCKEKKKAITIKDSKGSIEVPANPKKVVALTDDVLDSLIALGITPVGATEAPIKSENTPWNPYIKDKMKDVTVVGKEKEVNLGTIKELKPDLIIGSIKRDDKIYDKLKEIAPTVLTVRNPTMKQTVLTVGEAVGKKDKAQDLLKDFDKKAKAFKENSKDKENIEVSLVRFSDGKAQIYYNVDIGSFVLNEAGVKRPKNQRKSWDNLNSLVDTTTQATSKIPRSEEVKIQDMNKIDGDVIFYFTTDDKGKIEKNKWESNENWQTLKAVKNNKVIEVDPTYWHSVDSILSANKILEDLNKYLSI